MLTVTDSAAAELSKLLGSTTAKNKQLVIYFQGYGWGGPSLGMALEESIEGMEKLESNGISAYLDAGLKELLARLGNITIDFIKTAYGSTGYSVTVGDKNCSSGGCSC